MRSIGIDEDTKLYVSQNGVLNKELKSISYRFDEGMLRPEKNRYKPDFRRKAMTRLDAKVNKTIDANIRDDKNLYQVNDKNSVPNVQEMTETVENVESNSNSSSASSRMKPILRSWKGKGGNVHTL